VVPPQHHRAPVETALNAGLPVLCEKPMAGSPEDCAAMVACAKRTGVTFAVSQNYRYRPAMWTARKVLASGELGAIGQARLDFWLYLNFRGTFRETMDHPLILDMSIHHFDLIRFITGLDPVSVRAESWNPPWSQFRGDASACCLFEMANRARVLYNGSWHARGQHDGWNCSWLIECERGFLRIAGDRITKYVGEEPGKNVADVGEVVPLDPMPLTEQAYVLDDFARAISERRRPLTDGFDNLRSVGMVFGAVESLGRNARVALGASGLAQSAG
jgi:predicted dehydrogenase